jgi:hypothetical protein
MSFFYGITFVSEIDAAGAPVAFSWNRVLGVFIRAGVRSGPF